MNNPAKIIIMEAEHAGKHWRLSYPFLCRIAQYPIKAPSLIQPFLYNPTWNRLEKVPPPPTKETNVLIKLFSPMFPLEKCSEWMTNGKVICTFDQILISPNNILYEVSYAGYGNKVTDHCRKLKYLSQMTLSSSTFTLFQN